jgi:hypothetical protein
LFGKDREVVLMEGEEEVEEVDRQERRMRFMSTTAEEEDR